MSSQILTVLTALCGMAALATLAYAFGALGRAKASGAGFWICALLSLVGTCLGLAAGLKASAIASTSETLRAMPVLMAADVAKAPPGEGVALTGVAKASAPARVAGRQRPNAAPASADPAEAGNGVLAVEVHYQGEDEFEGEESDYVQDVDYGRETDVAPFVLQGAGDKPLMVDEDGFKVLPALPGEVKSVDTMEFSAAVGRNLMERETKRSIADGATVTVTGVVVDQGAQRVLLSLGPALSLLTDRPWPLVLEEAARKSRDATILFMVNLCFSIFGFLSLMVSLRFRLS